MATKRRQFRRQFEEQTVPAMGRKLSYPAERLVSVSGQGSAAVKGR